MIRRTVCFVFLFLTLVGTTRADSITTIQIDFGPPRHLPAQTELRISFSDLNGTVFNGQSQSIVLLVANQQWIDVSASSINVVLLLQTNIAGCPGFGSGTGYLLGQNGAPLHPALQLGSACGSNGFIGVGIIQPIQGPFSTYGFRFDLTYPIASGRTVANGVLIFYNENSAFVQPLPEPGIFSLLATAIVGLAASRRVFLARASVDYRA